MSSNRVVYQNWIADLGRDPGVRPDPNHMGLPVPFELADGLASGDHDSNPVARERRNRIKKAVAAALSKLEDNEREFIERYYFMGRTYREIADLSGRVVHRLEALHQRALRKLRKELAPLVKDLYDLTLSSIPDCPICSSPDRAQIDQLIAQRDTAGTWRPVIKRIKEAFGIRIVTPQTLIGHEKYH